MWSKTVFLVSIVVALSYCQNQDISENFNTLFEESSSHARIVNGAAARPAQFPWHAAIFTQRHDKRRIFCAGALVSNLAVVTDADCLINGAHVRVLLGSIVFNKGTEVLGKGFALHPKYNPRNRSYNLAILRLATKVQTNTYIQPISLPPLRYEFYTFPSQVAQLSGHGSIRK